MNIKTKFESLPCKLNQEELLEAGRNVAHAAEEKAKFEASLKAFKKQVDADIDSKDATIDSNVRKISTGVEYRDVECSVVADWPNRKMIYTRLDTNETVRTRDMYAEEIVEYGAPELPLDGPIQDAQEELAANALIYKHPKGGELKVLSLIDSEGEEHNYAVFHVKGNTDKRFKTKDEDFPEFENAMACQQKLDAYAQAAGLEIVE